MAIIKVDYGTISGNSAQVQEGEITLPSSGTVFQSLDFEPDYLRVYPTFPLSATYAVECIYTKNPDGFGGTVKTAQTKTYTSGSTTYSSSSISLPNTSWGCLNDVSSNGFTYNYYDNGYSVTKMKYIAIKYT